MNTVRIKKMRDNAKLPTKAYHSAGYDLYPAMQGIIKPGEQVKIPLGFATEFPSGYVAQIDDRSSTGNAGLSHMAGVLDSDYRGEWFLSIRNFSHVDYVYGPEKAIAQVLFIQVESPTWTWVEELSPTFRGDKAYGSSDANKQAYFDHKRAEAAHEADRVMNSPRVLKAVSEELVAQAEEKFVQTVECLVLRKENIKHLEASNELKITQTDGPPPTDPNYYHES